MPPKKKKAGGKKKAAVAKLPKPIIPPDNKLPQLVAVDTTTATIMHSVSTGDIRTMDRLIAHYNMRKGLDSKDINGSTPIHLAVKKNDQNALLGVLKYESVDIDALELRVIGGYSALHHACLIGNDAKKIMEVLLEHGANPNIKSNSTIGETPLHLCCKNGFVPLAQMLLEKGAIGTVVDNFGNNPTQWASRYKQEYIIREVELPPAKTATADDLLKMALANNPKFIFNRIVEKKKGKGDKEKGQKK